MAKISVVVIGDEILLGRVTDTNSGFIARAVEPYSWSVESVSTVGDSAPAIRQAIERALDATDVVITTGGLGPTKDDITKGVLMEIFGGALVEDADVLANVERVMTARGREVNDLSRAQALVPDSCTVIQNAVGTAPIMWFERGDQVLVALPGVPFEMEQMLIDAVLPRLLSHFDEATTVTHSYLVVADRSESSIAELLAPLEESLPSGMSLAYLPSPGYVKLRFDYRCPKGAPTDIVDAYAAYAAALIGDSVIAHADATPAMILLEELRHRHLAVATAESCTGGNIAHAITLIPGSSEAMMGGIVAYSNKVKISVLGVSPDTLEAHGAVSLPVVEQMAAGACRTCHADIAMATSGIAGPGGATPGKPVGTVAIAVSVAGDTISAMHHFAGNRQRVINHATTMALIMAIKRVRGL